MWHGAPLVSFSNASRDMAWCDTQASRRGTCLPLRLLDAGVPHINDENDTFLVPSVPYLAMQWVGSEQKHA